MKIIYQIAIVFSICWVGQAIEAVVPFPLPASVISMILLFFLLLTGILKIEHVREKSDFLLSNMAFFFIPAGVSVMNYFEVLKNSLVPLLIICLISTILTFAATAYSIKATLYFMKKRKKS